MTDTKPIEKTRGPFVSVWRDGTWNLYINELDAFYSRDDEDWLCEINLADHLTRPADPTPQQTREEQVDKLWGVYIAGGAGTLGMQSVRDEAARMFGDAALRRQNEVMRKALDFYANPAIYKPHPHGPAFDRREDLYLTANAARAALAECGAVLEDGK